MTTADPDGAAALALLPAAFDAFSHRVRGVPASRWQGASPCHGWTVRDVVNHVTAEHLWAQDLLRGRTVEDVGDSYDGDVLGVDPVASWDRASAGSQALWEAVDPQQPVALSAGPTPAGRYAQEMLLDLTVHAWDVARGAGLDESLPEDAVAQVLRFVDGHGDELTGSGLFDPPVDPGPADGDPADPQRRLLRALGRRP